MLLNDDAALSVAGMRISYRQDPDPTLDKIRILSSIKSGYDPREYPDPTIEKIRIRHSIKSGSDPRYNPDIFFYFGLSYISYKIERSRMKRNFGANPSKTCSGSELKKTIWSGNVFYYFGSRKERIKERKRAREREAERERGKESKRERETETERQREQEGKRARERERERESVLV